MQIKTVNVQIKGVFWKNKKKTNEKNFDVLGLSIASRYSQKYAPKVPTENCHN